MNPTRKDVVMKFAFGIILFACSFGVLGATMEKYSLIVEPAYWALYGGVTGMLMAASIFLSD